MKQLNLHLLYINRLFKKSDKCYVEYINGKNKELFLVKSRNENTVNDDTYNLKDRFYNLRYKDIEVSITGDLVVTFTDIVK